MAASCVLHLSSKNLASVVTTRTQSSWLLGGVVVGWPVSHGRNVCVPPLTVCHVPSVVLSLMPTQYVAVAPASVSRPVSSLASSGIARYVVADSPEHPLFCAFQLPIAATSLYWCAEPAMGANPAGHCEVGESIAPSCALSIPASIAVPPTH